MIFVIIWMIVLTHCSTQAFVSFENERIVIIDQRGFSTIKCCASDQGCHCSNLSLALENVKNDTEIKLMSDISLEYVTHFGNISNVTITGHDHTVLCNHQGGLVGNNIINIIIQGVIWDKCSGIVFHDFTCACINSSVFQHSTNNLATLVLVGHDLIAILNTTFLHNNLIISTLAQSINVYNSNFQGTRLNIDSSLLELDTVCVSIVDSNFNNASGILCSGTYLPTVIQVNVGLSNFSNNINSAVVLDKCHLSLLDNVAFYNNSAKGESTCSCGGGAISSCDSTVTVDTNGSVYFLNNKADYGGAICLRNSNVTVYQGFVTFCNNIAYDEGGAINMYSSTIDVNDTVILKFVNNTASRGGAMYFEFEEQSSYKSVILHHYKLLINSNHSENSAAEGGGDLAYFDYDFDDDCAPDESWKHKNLFASPPCSTTVFDAVVKANTSSELSGFVFYWQSDLKFKAVVLDYFNNFANPVEVSISSDLESCNQYYNDEYIIVECEKLDESDHRYTINSSHNDVTLVSNNTMECSCLSTYDKSLVSLYIDNAQFTAVVQWTGSLSTVCDDIAHYYYYGACNTYSCSTEQFQDVKIPGFICSDGYLAVTPGYWYKNSLHHYVISCPADYCNFSNWKYKILPEPFPDQDLQCKDNWIGFSCGECSHLIKYDSTDCISSDNCVLSSVPLSLLAVFVVSLMYWCLVISFIFILLHFNFSISAGYAFGIIFYYSVLELVVSVFNKVVQERKCAVYEDYLFSGCDLELKYISEILPFFSSIGNLKPPFMQYLKLCLGKAEVIDHKFLVYMHPLIVFSIVVIIFVSARRFVFVARYIGRYANSKSISLLVLLSYSSMSYTSVQLLRPLAHFKDDFDGSNSQFVGWRSYWSPGLPYFHSHHRYCVIIAILCEIIIGFGFPFLLLFQRYLTRHHNINFMSIRPIIDQLQACYKNECYWFSAYYLICRQVIYGVDIVFDFLLGFWMLNEEYIFAKYIALLFVCCLIMVIHVAFRPYRLSSLNVLDGIILLSLLLLLMSGLDGNSYRLSVVFWVLPLVIFINYLAYSTKMQHVVVLSSVCGLIVLLNLMTFIPVGAQLLYFQQHLKIGIVYILF